MLFDRRSFRIGAVAGAFLVIGVIAGALFAARQDWTPVAHGAEAPRPASAASAEGAAPVALPNFVSIAKVAVPPVVYISTTRVVKNPQLGATPFDDPMFRRFFGEEYSRRFQMPRERREGGLGSGVVVSADGYIITNNHVIAGADEIKVTLSDQREFTGKVIGTDPKSDVAVIKIEAKDLLFIPWGDSDKLEVGEYVLAVGNPFGLKQTVTFGIVSAVGRSNVGITDYEDFIQTDVAINPGNSGGALVNTRGELIGINTAIGSPVGANVGIGFAVPANMARNVMQSLIKSGKVVRGWLGVGLQPLTPDLARDFGLKDTRGALVSQVFPGTPAEAAGLMDGDIILSFDGKPVGDMQALRGMVADAVVGKTVKLEVLRENKTRTLSLKVAEQPKDMRRFAEDGSSDEGEDSVKDEGDKTAIAGVQVQNITPNAAQQLGLKPGTQGALVADVELGSPAERAGLARGDVVVKVNRTSVRDAADYRKAVARLKKGDGALLLVLRRGSQLYISIRP